MPDFIPVQRESRDEKQVNVNPGTPGVGIGLCKTGLAWVVKFLRATPIFIAES